MNYNGSDVLKLTLDSLLRTKVNVDYVVCLVENGSDWENREAAENAFIAFQNEHHGIVPDIYLQSEKNLGFCGGNNIGIQRLLELKEIERICLLNTDVIVSDGWLDKLTESDADIVGPVTNANGNEQTIWIDYEVERNISALKKVNEFAAFRGRIYSGYEVPSECVTGFCSLIKREVFEDIGLLDERFFPGGFDDSDFDKRVINKGGKVAIRRDCFIHHWGGGSFSKLAMSTRVGISYANMKRFEDKWNLKWEGTQYLLPVSVLQDVEFLNRRGIDSRRAWALIRETHKAIGEILKTYETSRINADRENYKDSIVEQLSDQSNPHNETIEEKNIMEINRLDLVPYIPAPGALELARTLTKTGQTLYHALRAPGRRHKALKNVLEFIARGKKEKKGTVGILAPYWRESKLRDGYYQRIQIVDQIVFHNYKKLYFESDQTNAFSIEEIDEDHMVIHFPPLNKEIISSLKMLMKACGSIYTHSLLRLTHSEMVPELLQWLTDNNVKLVWDVHGSVPEEAAFQDDWRGAQTYNTIEEILIRGADVMICVNHAMLEHFQKKYDYMERMPKPIIMPIFSGVEVYDELINHKLEQSDYSRPTVVYAGGVQAWQNIAMMQDVMAKTGHMYHYKMIVSDPDEFLHQYGDKTIPKDAEIKSLPPDAVQKEYEHSHFGFVLRDDITVNNVACPTKLIEYLCYGILPVMKTTRVGDFVRYGMEYLLADDLENGRIPTAEAYLEKIKHNREVLKKFQNDFISGQTELLHFIGG